MIKRMKPANTECESLATFIQIERLSDDDDFSGSNSNKRVMSG